MSIASSKAALREALAPMTINDADVTGVNESGVFLLYGGMERLEIGVTERHLGIIVADFSLTALEATVDDIEEKLYEASMSGYDISNTDTTQPGITESGLLLCTLNVTYKDIR